MWCECECRCACTGLSMRYLRRFIWKLEAAHAMTLKKSSNIWRYIHFEHVNESLACHCCYIYIYIYINPPLLVLTAPALFWCGCSSGVVRRYPFTPLGTSRPRADNSATSLRGAPMIYYSESLRREHRRPIWGLSFLQYYKSFLLLGLPR